MRGAFRGRADARILPSLRRHRRRRRPRRHRSRARRRAHGRAHAAADAQHRDAGPDELQPGDRRHRQGPPGQGDRRARRRDGARGRRGRHPVPHRSTRRKGPAVRATRARPTACCTRRPSARGWRTSRTSTLFQQAVDDLIVEGDARARRRHADRASRSAARAVVLTAGTFLAGKIHVGLTQLRGRPRRRSAGDRAGARGCASCRSRVGRLKTGTPPRIDGRTHRLLGAGRAARRRSGAGVLVPRLARRASAPGPLLDHAHQRAHARDHPRRRSTARRCSPA